jgi:hypothetical protein
MGSYAHVMRHAFKVNSWRFLKLICFVSVTVVLYYLLSENYSLRDDNARLSGVVNMFRDCIVSGKN